MSKFGHFQKSFFPVCKNYESKKRCPSFQSNRKKPKSVKMSYCAVLEIGGRVWGDFGVK